MNPISSLQHNFEQSLGTLYSHLESASFTSMSLRIDVPVEHLVDFHERLNDLPEFNVHVETVDSNSSSTVTIDVRLTRSEASERTERDILQTDELMERLGGNTSLLERLAGIFTQSGTQYLAEIESALVDKDAEQLNRAAHTLKGAVSSLGGARATEAIRELEDCAGDPDMKNAPLLLANVRFEIQAFETELQKFVQTSNVTEQVISP